MGMGGTPLLILKEGTKREKGKEAKLDNIFAAKAVADAVRSTLGPRGMDKMLVDSAGDIVITNDGVTIATEMDVQHPAAKMMVEVAKAMDLECGDGTTTAMVLAGDLLAKAEGLIEMDIHPTIITRGYKMAAVRALNKLDEISLPVGLENTQALKRLATTSMMSKAVSDIREHLADIAVKAVGIVARKDGLKTEVDLGNVLVIKKQGGSSLETEIVPGMILEKSPVLRAMSRSIIDARIALISGPLEVKKTELSSSIEITDTGQMQAFLDEEEHMLKDMVRQIAETGANVLVCEKKID
ncbi:MAG TPA: TCP-1/cpn60 chaperonin family protein, partial [Methanomassiliicoccales archaeon]|nr:TCP-1/cpn60 chaperonin family protein [Methanomassiliicoccales archaeon]